VAESAVWIAKSYGDFTSEQIRDIEIASYLAQAGKDQAFCESIHQQSSSHNLTTYRSQIEKTALPLR